MTFADQLTYYFEIIQLFHSFQHGFKINNPRETALHYIISELNNVKDKSLIVSYFTCN